MLKIDPLKRIIENCNGINVSRLPNNEEIIKKINEIINYINNKDKVDEDNPFMPQRKNQ